MMMVISFLKSLWTRKTKTPEPPSLEKAIHDLETMRLKIEDIMFWISEEFPEVPEQLPLFAENTDFQLTSLTGCVRMLKEAEALKKSGGPTDAA